MTEQIDSSLKQKLNNYLFISENIIHKNKMLIFI
jgi:hypothetical protein